jgi:hypothetical protein
MGAMKELMQENFESVMETDDLKMNGDEVWVFYEMMEIQGLLLFSDNEALQRKEQQWFEGLHIDTADFLTDWLSPITAAVTVFTGMGTTEDGLIGNSFDMMAYHFHTSPRRTVRAMQKMGLNDRSVQGIIYLLTGRLLDANNALNIVRFEYLDKQKHPEKTVMSRIV